MRHRRVVVPSIGVLVGVSLVTVLDTKSSKNYVMIPWAVYVTVLNWNMTELKEEVTKLLC